MSKQKFSTIVKYCILCNQEIPKNKKETWERYHNKKFCSTECHKIFRENTKETFCKECNKKFLYHGYRENVKYCSYECYWKGKQNKIEKICTHCGKTYITTPNGSNQVFCSLECQYNSDIMKKAGVKSRMILNKQNGLNKLELKGRELLFSLGLKKDVNFIEQYQVNDKFIVDVFIPENNLVIQWDGDYWHGHPFKLKEGNPNITQKKRMNKDISQDAYMKKCGMKVLRFWEHEILNNKENVINSIKEQIERSM